MSTERSCFHSVTRYCLALVVLIALTFGALELASVRAFFGSAHEMLPQLSIQQSAEQYRVKMQDVFAQVNVAQTEVESPIQPMTGPPAQESPRPASKTASEIDESTAEAPLEPAVDTPVVEAPGPASEPEAIQTSQGPGVVPASEANAPQSERIVSPAPDRRHSNEATESHSSVPASSITKFDPRASLLKNTCVHSVWRKHRDTSSGKSRTNAMYDVMDPEATFEMLRRGASIFRFGDGELRLMSGVPMINHGMEVNSKQLTNLLKAVASLGGHAQAGGPCVGLVPMMDGNTKRFRSDSKVLSWVSGKSAHEYQSRIRSSFPPGKYCSASITRPDHLADWDYDRLIAGWASVFAGKTVLYIRPVGAGSDAARQSALREVFSKARAVIKPDFVKSANRGFSLHGMILDRIHEELRRTHIDIVVVSLGPTATILAAELGCQGVQALDFGSLSGKPGAKKV